MRTIMTEIGRHLADMESELVKLSDGSYKLILPNKASMRIRFYSEWEGVKEIDEGKKNVLHL